ncbi:uncharacterized protein LOC125032598 [Penaeus chinensis]|uniref:uncharacterized protein LOC125032598 n=1 Tax=Penaeus chinensis TaxID=139456 RepID=UPI001FB5A9A5|nr:uncharacterized protein LOC125032598 [Penaeus chinensis]
MQVFRFLPVFFGAVLFAASVNGGREKRYLFINPEAPITLGFLLNMPISLALPTLASVNGRSLQFLMPAEGEEIPDDLLWEPAYEEQLGRLSAYFAHLELPTLSCQERLVCELAADPDSFSPIGEIFMKELRLTHGPVKTTSDSLMWRYISAAREGFGSVSGQCAEAFPVCPYAPNRILNMAVLKVWKYISERLNLQLV